MAGHRGDDEHLGLRRRQILLEAQQVAEWCCGHHGLAHLHMAVLHLHGLQREWAALVGDFGIRQHIGGGGDQARPWPGSGKALLGGKGQPQPGTQPGWRQKVGLGLVELVEHSARRDRPGLSAGRTAGCVAAQQDASLAGPASPDTRREAEREQPKQT